MMQRYWAAVAGGVSGLVVGGAGSLIAMLTPLPTVFPRDAPVVAQVATVSLLVFGAAVGVLITWLTNRRAADGPEADYLDGPRPASPSAGGLPPPAPPPEPLP